MSQLGRGRRMQAVRRGRSELEHHVLDEFLSGKLDRRSFLQRASIIGLAAPIAAFVAACDDEQGAATSSTSATTLPVVAEQRQRGGRLRVGIIAPTDAVDPVRTNDPGRIVLIAQTGEYLVRSGAGLTLDPSLAVSWTPNHDGTAWTFALREGVTFNDGRPMTADDVVATFDRLTDETVESAALVSFRGILSNGATSARDDRTVVFELDTANGNFPYLVSSDNYNTVILPARYDDYESTWPGTGAWRLSSFTPEVGITFEPNPSHWAGPPLLDEVEFSFYADDEALVEAMTSDVVDVIQGTTSQGSDALAATSVPIQVRSAAHTQVHLRVDEGPFKDRRVRRALALLFDRAAVVGTLLDGRGDVGNDSPFATAYPSSDAGAPQRDRDLAEAKRLLDEAGIDEIDEMLTGFKTPEIEHYARIIRDAAAEVGLSLRLSITDTYYDYDWLNSHIGIAHYAHRGVPDQYLTAPLRTNGAWNAAHFSSREYDTLVDDYIGAVDLGQQRRAARQIQELLLEETPLLITYFKNVVAWTAPGVEGVELSAAGHVQLEAATHRPR
jgi:peptide/nickel transport system substrate-binding protein